MDRNYAGEISRHLLAVWQALNYEKFLRKETGHKSLFVSEHGRVSEPISNSMCGIAGIVGVPEELAQELSERMLATMHHRGPDHSATTALRLPSGGGAVYLLHTRLSILDTSAAGNQPMQDTPAGEALPNWVVFNGEIYNYLSLKRELAEQGSDFRTHCDTEVILYAYRRWGTRAAEQLRGMFAWGLADMSEGRLWLCRDRLGIKPLYTCRPACGGLIFASEVRTILAAGPAFIEPRLDPASLEAFLAQGAVFGEASIMEGITSLPPAASVLINWDGSLVSQQRYWQIPLCGAAGSPVLSRAAAVGALAKTLRETLSGHLLSDVPIGLFLSSGIDSAALATVASEVSSIPLRTLTIGFDVAEFDESTLAEGVAKSLGTEHTTVRLSGEGVLEELPHFLAAIDQPTVDGFNTYLVSKVARAQGLTVALSGLGGDELFGGYASFRDVARALRLRRGAALAPGLSRLLAKTCALAGGRMGAKLSQLFSRPASPLEMYLLRRELFMPEERRSLFNLPPDCSAANGLRHSLLTSLPQGQELSSNELVSLYELSLYMQYMLLRDADVFSMSSGLEIRVPLLDHRLVETIAALPAAWRFSSSQPKALLVEAAGRRFPSFVLRRRKRGFAFPWAAWLRGPWQSRAQAVLEQGEFWRELGINPAAVSAFWRRFLAGDRSVSPLQILAFIVAEDYLRRQLLLGHQDNFERTPP